MNKARATLPEVVNSKKISESLCFPLFIFFTAMSELRELQVLRGPCEGLKVAPRVTLVKKHFLEGVQSTPSDFICLETPLWELL